MKLEAFIPGPIVGVNQTYRAAGAGRKRRIYKSSEAKAWQAGIAHIVGAAAGRCGWCDRGGPFRLYLTLSGAPKFDLDAPLKLCQDALADKLGFNDRRIIEVILRRDDQGPTGVLIVLDEVLAGDPLEIFSKN